MSEPVNAFWREPKPLILASKSRARAALLQQVTVPRVPIARDLQRFQRQQPQRAD